MARRPTSRQGEPDVWRVSFVSQLAEFVANGTSSVLLMPFLAYLGAFRLLQRLPRGRLAVSPGN